MEMVGMIGDGGGGDAGMLPESSAGAVQASNEFL